MAKTNFSKVEEALAQGILKMSVEKLMEYADLAAMMGGANSTKDKVTSGALESQGRILKVLERDAVRLHKKDHSLYKNMGIEKKQLDDLFAKTVLLTPKEWELVRQIQLKLKTYKDKMRKSIPKEADDKLVDKERKKHINKRFNVRDEWLPLK